MDELLDTLGQILGNADPASDALQYEDPASGLFREHLAELRRRSSDLLNTFPEDAFPLVARAAREFSNRVNLLVADFPGQYQEHKASTESIKTIWYLQVRPELYRVELALAVTAGIVLPEDPAMYAGKDRYLREIVFEINRCHRNGAHNACSVLLRRLLETLIIQAHEKRGTAASAQNPATGRFYRLDKLIDDLSNGNPFNLTRNALDALPKLKRLGDWAAHNRNVLIRSTDIDQLKADARLCFEELFRLA